MFFFEIRDMTAFSWRTHFCACEWRSFRSPVRDASNVLQKTHACNQKNACGKELRMHVAVKPHRTFKMLYTLHSFKMYGPFKEEKLQ